MDSGLMLEKRNLIIIELIKLNNMYEQSAELREDYTDHYGRITEIDKKLADEFEREHIASGNKK